ncbi:HTH-type transcriptional regulator MalR [mine drainage metagenome]|uniref:HTH-type transcriptional regulator MalR n=1 Tax=mine drainage metagenome TaxID=410659 RepID=A0A1J5PY02_9ZZZZ
MATRADVAKLAGVSESTVSYALSGVRSIKPETRERVLSAVAELNYHPHFAAGALAGGKAKALALHFPGGEYGIAASVLEYLTGAANAARERGYHLILWPNADTQMSEIEVFCKSGLIGGVLLMEIRLEDDRAKFLTEADVPFVLIGRTSKPDLFKYVDRDFELVSQKAIDYLFQLGHRRIAFTNNERKYKGVRISVDTRFQRAIVKHSKKIGVEITELPATNEPASGRNTFIELRDKHPNVTALIGVNDLVTTNKN